MALTCTTRGPCARHRAPVLRAAYEECVGFGGFTGKFGQSVRFTELSDLGQPGREDTRWNASAADATPPGSNPQPYWASTWEKPVLLVHEDHPSTR